MGAVIAVVNKKGENAAQIAVEMLKTIAHKRTENFGIATPNIIKIEGSADALQNKGINSPILIGQIFTKILSTDKPQPIKLEDATMVFEGRLYPTTENISDVESFTRDLKSNVDAGKALIKKIEGDFAFLIAKHKRLIAGRDIIGVYPLYYGENMKSAALASERKALWRIGIKQTNSFPPGHLALVDEHGFRFEKIKTLDYSETEQITMQTAANRLQTLLELSIKHRVSGLEDVALAFSGGLDSSIIAFLAKKSGVNIHLIHVSLHDQQETESAIDTAAELNLPLNVYLFDEKDVEKVLPKVLWLIEEPDPVKVGISIPLYWVAEKTAELGLSVLLAGQGADEFFGGYKRYVSDYLRCEDEVLHRIMFNDAINLHKTNFERDFKICNFHNVELRLPFATYDMAKFAVRLPLKLKLEKKEDGLRKLVLRQVAENVGLPRSVVKKPKKAIQYATGVNKALRRLADREKMAIRAYLQKKFQQVFEGMLKNEQDSSYFFT